MLDFYEKKGRRIFTVVVIGLVVMTSFVLIWNGFISFNKEVSQMDKIVENTNKSMAQIVQKKEYNGQIEYLEGSVEKRSNKDLGWFKVEKSDIVKSGEEIRTLADSRAIVTFEDGSTVRLDENTSILFDGSGGNIDIGMDRGFVYNKVAKNDKREYSVKTGEYTVTALGTEFSVENDGSEVDVMVVESSVQVTNDNEEIIEEISEGSKASVKDGKVEKENLTQEDLEDDFVAWNIAKSDNKEIKKEKEKKVEKKEKEEDEKVYTTGTIKLSGEKSSSGVRLHWDTSGVNTGHGFKVIKSKEVNPVYPGNDYKYLSDSGVRDYKWKIDTGKKYHFRVCAYQGDGKCGIYSNDVYVDTPSGDSGDDNDDGYASKVSLSASKDGDDVKLKWDISGGSAPKGFKVVKSKSKNPVYPGDDYKYLSDGDTRKYTWKDLSDDKTYYFRVCIYKGGKCGTYSNNIKVEM
ncbi:MAG: FecR domain-containing protein [Candidatus Moraniibacteriota bacterium]|jgi:FecR-like protein